MKSFFYKLFALSFNTSKKLLKVKDNRVAFVSMHNEQFNDSLGSMRCLLESRGGFELIDITRNDIFPKNRDIVSVLSGAFRFFLVKSRQMATSRYVFLNDNFMPMGLLNFSDKTFVTQLWHAEGVFKRFGLAIRQPDDVRKREVEANKRLDAVVCSSEAVRPYYAQAFGVDEKKVLPLGSPRTDFLFGRDDISALKECFYAEHPLARGKKLVLYAPTFRDDSEKDARLLEAMDIELFNRRLGDDYQLLIRLHPQLHAADRSFTGAIDLTDYENPVELVLLSDILITDYSSICMDFALLEKPAVFYAFDLDSYNADRSFYFDYESYVPGTVVKSMDALIQAVANAELTEKNSAFKSFNFDSFDGHAAERVAREIMGI